MCAIKSLVILACNILKCSLQPKNGANANANQTMLTTKKVVSHDFDDGDKIQFLNYPKIIYIQIPL